MRRNFAEKPGLKGLGAGVGCREAAKKSVGCSGFDCQRVDIRVHEVSHGREYQPVALDWRQSLELITDDSDPKMAFAVPGPGMACMQMALVFHLKRCRLKSLGESLADFGDALCGHGSTSLKGLTMTLAYTPAAT